MGEIMLRSGSTERMYGAMGRWLSWLPGGLMHSNIAACAMFAATSGSSVATAVMVFSPYPGSALFEQPAMPPSQLRSAEGSRRRCSSAIGILRLRPAGVETIIDVATGPSPDQQAATEFFTTATRNLQEAGERAGVRRLVLVSIIGIDEFAGGYNAAKVAHEQAALAGPIPARIVRAQVLSLREKEFIEASRAQGAFCIHRSCLRRGADC
jgi:hypothetical protein